MRNMNEHIMRLVLGLGLDGGDGDIRITRGPNFRLFGGSQPTHERMQETCMRFNEELRRLGKSFEEVGLEEAREIIRRIDSRL